MTDPRAVGDMVATVVAATGRLDVAVNNAGAAGEYSDAAEHSIDGWHASIQVNLSSVFYCIKHELGAMLASGGGSIVNTASIMGTVGSRRAPAYGAAKHGVIGLTKSVALQYADRGIRINSIGPGYIETDLSRFSIGAADRQVLAEATPLGRWGTPDEVAGLVCFLASRDAAFITGSHHVVDGGYTTG